MNVCLYRIVLTPPLSALTHTHTHTHITHLHFAVDALLYLLEQLVVVLRHKRHTASAPACARGTARSVHVVHHHPRQVYVEL
jgi:hypothetical protein